MTQVAPRRLGIGNDVAVSVEHVTQRFSLRHEKTLKGVLVNAVTRRHPSKEKFLALDDVSLEIPRGVTMGLIGHNGSGKSTLLKTIGGVLTPTSGQVTRRGRLAALLELGAGFHRDLSGRENVFLNGELLGLSKTEVTRKFDDIVEFSGVEQFIDTPMKFYSSGMFVRLGFSLAISTEPDILLVDEVLAVGDEQFQAKCLDVVRQFQAEGRTIVLVTHNMGSIRTFCDQAVLLHHGVIRAQGVPGDVIARFRQLTAGAAEQAPAAGKGSRATPPRGRPVDDQREGRGRPVELARVVKAEVRSVSGRSLGAFQPPDGLVVDATFSSPGGVDLIGRVELFAGGQLLHGTSTARLGLAPLRDQGEATYRFTFPEVPLAGGKYRVAVSIAGGPTAQAVHSISEVAEVIVPMTHTRVGPLDIAPTVVLWQ